MGRGRGRGTGKANVSAAPVASPGLPSGDPLFSSVSMLLQSETTNGDTTFTDSSSFMKSLTGNGSIAHSTAQAKFGSSSIAFDGVNDSITVPTGAELDTASTDFTIEAWIRLNSLADYSVIYSQISSPTVYEMIFMFDISSGLVAFNNIGFNCSQGSTAGWAIDTWYHVAVEKTGSTYRVYRDGVVLKSVTGSASSARTTCQVGVFSNIWHLDGYLEEFRFTSAARYSGAFVPPSAPFPIS